MLIRDLPPIDDHYVFYYQLIVKTTVWRYFQSPLTGLTLKIPVTRFDSDTLRQFPAVPAFRFFDRAKVLQSPFGKRNRGTEKLA
jgi:hypothetical protein